MEEWKAIFQCFCAAESLVSTRGLLLQCAYLSWSLTKALLSPQRGREQWRAVALGFKFHDEHRAQRNSLGKSPASERSILLQKSSLLTPEAWPRVGLDRNLFGAGQKESDSCLLLQGPETLFKQTSSTGVWLILSYRCGDQYRSCTHASPLCPFGLFREDAHFVARVLFVFVKPTKFCFKQILVYSNVTKFFSLNVLAAITQTLIAVTGKGYPPTSFLECLKPSHFLFLLP